MFLEGALLGIEKLTIGQMKQEPARKELHQRGIISSIEIVGHILGHASHGQTLSICDPDLRWRSYKMDFTKKLGFRR